jgi:hypothetical protein
MSHHCLVLLPSNSRKDAAFPLLQQGPAACTVLWARNTTPLGGLGEIGGTICRILISCFNVSRRSSGGLDRRILQAGSPNNLLWIVSRQLSRLLCGHTSRPLRNDLCKSGTPAEKVIQGYAEAHATDARIIILIILTGRFWKTLRHGVARSTGTTTHCCAAFDFRGDSIFVNAEFNTVYQAVAI